MKALGAFEQSANKGHFRVDRAVADLRRVPAQGLLLFAPDDVFPQMAGRDTVKRTWGNLKRQKLGNFQLTITSATPMPDPRKAKVQSAALEGGATVNAISERNTRLLGVQPAFKVQLRTVNAHVRRWLASTR